MFTFVCTTCEAELVVKNKKLVGKVLACPKCGCMVLVPPSDEAPTPPPRKTPKLTVHKKFPDVLTHETSSGIIGQVPKESRRSALFLEIASPEASVSETELKTRKFLVGILIGLAVLVLIVFGFLMLRKPVPPPQPKPPQPVIQIPIEPLPVVPPPEEVHAPPPDEEPVVVVPQETPSENTFVEPASPEREPLSDEPVTNDLLSSFESKLPGLLETSVPNIDIAAKLALPILELNLRQQSLIEFVRTMSNLTGIPITLDIDEIKPLSVKTPVTGHFQEATVGTILTETLATLGLKWIATDRQILISPVQIFPGQTDAVDLSFDVSDFAEHTDDLTPKVLAEMIQRLVCPEVNVAVLPEHRLAVVQGEHDRTSAGKSGRRLRTDILRFLEQLRAVRQLPPQTTWTSEILAPEAFGWDRMMEPMTLNHYRAVDLARVIEQLESITRLTILIDHQSLHRALSPFATIQTTVQCNDGTVNDALELSLASVESVALAYRIIDHQTLEITTAESARQKMVVEVHRYQLQEGEEEDIFRALRLIVEPESWFVPERPETQYGGDMVIDHPSGCLLIRQNQPAQRQIRLYLSTLETQ